MKLPKKPPTDIAELMTFVEYAQSDFITLIREVGEAKASVQLNNWRIVQGLIGCYAHYNKSLFRHLKNEALTVLGISERQLRNLINENKPLLETKHGNHGKQNRLKINEEEHLQVVRAMLKRHATQQQIAAKLQLSQATVNKLVNDPKYLQGNIIAKWGWKEYQSRFDLIIKREPPSRTNILWVADGTTLELLADLGNNKAGRFYWVYIIDACTWDLIGYSIGKTESFALVKKAFFNAYKNTGVLPTQIQSDNGSAFKSKEAKAFLLGICSKFTPHEVGNARAKIVEGWWNVFNASFLKDEANWTGKNITAKSGPMLQSALTTKLKEVMKFGLLNINGVQTQLERCLEEYRKVIVSGRTEGKDIECGGKKINDYEAAILFWDFLENKQDVQNRYNYTNKGINIMISGNTYQYMVQSNGIPDKVFHLTGISKLFRVKIDKDNPQNGIVLYEGDKPVIMANLVDAMPMAIADHTPETRARLAAMLAQKKENKQHFEELARLSVDEEFTDNQMTNYKLALGHLAKTDLNSGEEFVKFEDLDSLNVPKTKPKKPKKVNLKGSNIEILKDNENNDFEFVDFQIIED